MFPDLSSAPRPCQPASQVLRILPENNFFSAGLDKTILQKFFEKFIPMLTIYYSINNRTKVLAIIRKYWHLLSAETRNQFGEVVATVLRQSDALRDFGAFKFGEYLKQVWANFDKTTQEKLISAMADFVSSNKAGKVHIEGLLSELR